MDTKVLVQRHGADRPDWTYYTAYCLRCHDQIVGNNSQRNSSWETKTSATKNAQLHADMHRKADERAMWNEWDIVGEVN
jgi:hypothetical protein